MFLYTYLDRAILQFHLLPIRDWNSILIFVGLGFYKLQFHLLPIRDWNLTGIQENTSFIKLQFHLLPIRDWNRSFLPLTGIQENIAISFTPY